MSAIISSTRRAPTLLPSLAATLAAPGAPTTPRRSHQTTARTKRALRIRPHPTHALRTTGPATDEIIFNPPSSQPTPYHTPFKFLPPSDPRRSSNLALLFPNSNAAAGEGEESRYVPPETRRATHPKMYHVTKEQVEEMRKLRFEDPEAWTVQKLAAKYGCTTKFVRIAARVPVSYRERLAEDTRRKMATWGARKVKAFQEKGQRVEMLFRGEL